LTLPPPPSTLFPYTTLFRSALIELAYQLQQTRDVAKSVPGSQLNWTMAKGGDVGNQIPELASAYGDVRVSANGAAQKLQTALQRSEEHTSELQSRRDLVCRL